MNTDDATKILFILSICFAIIGISFQLMRLLGSITDNVSDLRKTIKNTGELSDRLIQDYDYISKQLKNFADAISNVANNVINPIVNIFSFLKKIKTPK